MQWLFDCKTLANYVPISLVIRLFGQNILHLNWKTSGRTSKSIWKLFKSKFLCPKVQKTAPRPKVEIVGSKVKNKIPNLTGECLLSLFLVDLDTKYRNESDMHSKNNRVSYMEYVYC